MIWRGIFYFTGLLFGLLIFVSFEINFFEGFGSLPILFFLQAAVKAIFFGECIFLKAHIFLSLC